VVLSLSSAETGGLDDEDEDVDEEDNEEEDLAIRD
jgi:hypothetical protein